MGCLVFGIYLSLTFLIGGGGGSAQAASVNISALYPLGFFLYSLVPVSRLLYVTKVVDGVVRKADATRIKLYSMEAATADDHCAESKIRKGSIHSLQRIISLTVTCELLKHVLVRIS